MVSYPAEHFPGTPKLGIWVVTEALWRTGMSTKWQVPLEVIARYESDWNPYIPVSDIAPDARGLMQCATGMYESYDVGIDYTDPVLAVEIAIQYITSNLIGYGGYEILGAVDGVKGLLPRTDRGPGDVLRKWIANPTWGYQRLRPYYHGY